MYKLWFDVFLRSFLSAHTDWTPHIIHLTHFVHILCKTASFHHKYSSYFILLESAHCKCHEQKFCWASQFAKLHFDKLQAVLEQP